MASFFQPKYNVEPSRRANVELVLTDDSSSDYDDDVSSLEGSLDCSVISDVTTGTFESLGQALYQMVDRWYAVHLVREIDGERDGGTPSSSSSPHLDEPPPKFSPLQTSHGLSISVVVDSSWQDPALEVVPTDRVEDIMPLWKSEWTRDLAEWEERRKSPLAIDAELERSRTHDIDSLPTYLPLDRVLQSDVTDRNRGDVSILPPSEVSTNEWNEKWARFIQEKEHVKFNEIAIESIALPLSVGDFYNRVLADDADDSLEKFMHDIGEKDVDTSPWDQTPSSSAASDYSASRAIRYTHPVNAPMAPPTAKARKQQVLHKFGNAGLCVETCTIVEEVPMADCFVVEDRVWVHGAVDGSEGCSVSATFRIRFIKGTMFRKIIENTTRKEYGVFWNRFAGMVRGLAGVSQEAANGLDEVTIIPEGGMQEVPSSTDSSFIRGLSLRLWSVTIPPSAWDVARQKNAKETFQMYAQSMVTHSLSGVRYLTKLLPEDNYALVVACAAFLLMISLNVVAISQMVMLSRFLQKMDARLESIDLHF